MTNKQRLLCIKLLRTEVIPMLWKENDEAIKKYPKHIKGFEKDTKSAVDGVENTIYVLETFKKELGT